MRPPPLDLPPVDQHRLAAVEPVAWRAAQEVRARYGRTPRVRTKSEAGDSPVTDADEAANAILVEGLARAFPQDGLLAEESADHPDRLGRRQLWCVDPIDGTAEFIQKTGDFAVMVGLAVAGRAHWGLVVRPTLEQMVLGVVGHGAFVKEGPAGSWRPLVAQRQTTPSLRVAISRAHRPARLLAQLAPLGPLTPLPMGSIGVKMVAVAAGQADLYLTFSTTMSEWDTCAPEAICRAAGVHVTGLDGQPLTYNKPRPLTPLGVVAAPPAQHGPVLATVAPLARERGLLPPLGSGGGT